MKTSQSLQFFKLPDEEIIAIVLGGNKDIFEEIVKRYYNKLATYLSRLLNFNTQDVEDCLSETFLKTFTHLTLYNQSLKFSSWLYRIAHNQAVDLIRKKTRIPTFNLDWFHYIPDKTAEYSITNQRLESVLDRLPFKERNLLTLFHIQELTLEEISDILKLKTNTIAVQLKRARIKAKKIIEKYKL
jgi:RNA polymerase sigma-70 factor, ECF subfamily